MSRRFSRMGWIILAVLLCLALVAFPACTQTGEEEEEEEIETIQLACITALSGPAAPWGIALQRGLILSQEKQNAAGGFTVNGQKYEWDTVFYDNKYMTADTVVQANKAIYEDNIKFVCIQGGGNAIAATPTMKEANVLGVHDATGGEDIITPDNPLNFFWCPNIVTAYAASYPWFRDNRGVKTIAVITSSDETGMSGLEMAKFVLEQTTNVTLVDEEVYDIGTTDFYPILTKVLAKNPDMIDTCYSDPGSFALMLKQSRELGFEGIFYGGWGASDVQVVDVAGEQAEGAYIGTICFGLPSDSAEEMYNAFCQKWPASDWMDWMPMLYSYYPTLSQAIEEAGSLEPAKIADVLEDMEWQDPIGGVFWGGSEMFGIKRQISWDVWNIGQIQNGKAVLVAQPTFDVDMIR